MSYLIGCYVAARAAGRPGGRHGALTAVLGLIVGIALAIVLGLFGIIFAEGAALPPVGFGFAGAALLAGILLFLTNLFGGFIGGETRRAPGCGWHEEKLGLTFRYAGRVVHLDTMVFSLESALWASARLQG